MTVHRCSTNSQQEFYEAIEQYIIGITASIWKMGVS
jgi:hypothetical protein